MNVDKFYQALPENLVTFSPVEIASMKKVTKNFAENTMCHITYNIHKLKRYCLPATQILYYKLCAKTCSVTILKKLYNFFYKYFLTVGTWEYFPGATAQPRSDADHSPPSSAEVKNE
jgi:hypothetical protein